MKPLPLYTHHALRVAELPLHHRDPFDRLLVAQAQMEGLPLMTADPKLAAYDVEIIWAGREEGPQQIQ
jgi:PIN domain nuclease of toxin-antitoxin system